MIRIFAIFCTLSLMAFSAANTWAFFPSTSTVLRKLQNNYGNLHSYQGEISFDKDPFLKLRFWNKEGKWRQEWIVDRGSNSTLAAAAVGERNFLTASFPYQGEFPLPILHFWFRPQPLSWWKNLGVKPEVKSYQFFNMKPCLVLGAEYVQSEEPQIWIHNERFFPVRLVAPGELICNWEKYYNIGNFPLPHQGTLIFPDGSEVEMDITWNRVNKNIQNSHFSEEQFLQQYSHAFQPAFSSDLFEVLFNNLPFISSY